MTPTESLDEYLEKINAPAGSFSIKDDNEADWACRKIVRRLAEIDANKKLAELRKQQIDDWLAIVNHDSESEITFFTELLRPYIETRLADQKSKTLKLPSGTVALRKASPELTIGGEKIGASTPALLEYVRKSNPDFLKITESVEWGELKKTLIPTESGKVITSDGEILDFMAAWQPPDSINVKGVLK